MTSRRNKFAARAVVAVVIALVAHAVGGLVFVSLLDFLPAPLPPRVAASSNSQGEDRAKEDERDRPMEIESIVDELSRPDEKTPEEKAKEEQAKKEEEDKNPSGQVVDIARPAIEERPDNAKFVSEFDSKVDHETKAPNGRDHGGASAEVVPPVGRPDVSEPRPGSHAAAPVVEESGRPGRPGPLAMRELERRRAAERAAEGPEATPDGELERAGSTATEQKPAPARDVAGEGGTPGARRASPGSQEAAQPGLPGNRVPNLHASNDVLQHALGKGAGSMDYLKDVDDGEATALNSKRWKHAPFFNRVKRAVADQWHPDVVYMIHDSSGHVYGFKDRITVLRIHLDPQGKLVAWQVLQSSGVDFLDDEAISAFRKAGPFPNPPKDLVDTDGQIHFNFGFAFELSGRGSVKVYKYQ